MPQMNPKLHDQVRELLESGMTRQQVAESTVASISQVIRVATGFYASAGKPREMKPRERLPSIESVLGPMRWKGSDPSPEVIAEACAKLRRHRPRPKVGAEVNGENYSFPVFSTTSLFGRGFA